MNEPANRPDLIVIPHKASRFPARIALPIAVLSLAMFGLVLRAASPDWRGLWQEASLRGRSFFAATPKPRPVKPSPELAKAEVPRPAAPVEKPKPAPEAKPTPDPKADAAWDDIKRDAEKAQAELDEAENLKEKAAEDLAKNPPRRRIGPDPALLAEMQRRQAEMIRQMEALMGEPQRDFDEMVRGQLGALLGDQDRRVDEILRGQNQRRARMMDELARRRRMPNAMPDFGNFGPPLPGMDRMIPPLPGMDRMAPPLPGQPRVHEESGEEVRDGVRRTWKTRIVVIGGG